MINSVDYKNKYLKYKKKYLNLKGGASGSTHFPITVKFYIETNNNILPLGINFMIKDNELDISLKELIGQKIGKEHKLIKLLNKYDISNDRYVKIDGLIVNDILQIKLSDYKKSENKFLIITLVSEEESQEIKELKLKLKFISDIKNKKLFFISIASYLQTNDDLKSIVYQQFLPHKLINKSYLDNFEYIYIFLIDAGFKFKQKKNNLLIKKNEILQHLNMTFLDKKLIIEIIPSHVPDIDKFIKSLSQYKNENTVIFSSMAGNDVSQA